MTEFAFDAEFIPDNRLDNRMHDHGFDPPTLAKIKPASPWSNPDICDRLKVLWADHSASEICVVLKAEFSVEVSRNAVVGRLHRDKLTLDQKTIVHPLTSGSSGPRAKYSKPGPKPKPKTERAAPRVTHESPEIKAMRCAEITPLNVSLFDLAHGQCKFPYGDGPFTFCGHAALKDRSYCPAHRALSVKPTRGLSA